MKTRNSLLVLPLLAALSMAVGCGSGDSPTDPAATDGVSFNYSGAISGSYSAAGTVPWTGPAPQFGTFAMGFWEDGWLEVWASRAIASPRSDVFYFEIENLTGPRTATIGADAYVEFLANFNWNTSSYDRYCDLESGSVQVTAVNNQRAQGTFSGQGRCYDSADIQQGAFTISNGVFNVPIIP